MTNPKYDTMIVDARRMMARAATLNENYRGKCSDCKFSKLGTLSRRCTHPYVKLHAFEIEASYEKRRIVDYDEQRTNKSTWGTTFCKPEGFLFEPSRKKIILDFLTRHFKNV